METVFSRKSLCLCTVLFISAFANLFADAEKPNIEKAIADAEKAVETREPDYQVSAFELSVYYQGFTPEIIGTLDRFDVPEGPWRTYNEVPRDCDLKHPIKVRDAQKALYYAEIANDGKRYMILSATNLADLYLKGIGIAKDVEKAKEILGEKAFSEIYVTTYGSARMNEIYAPLIAYMYYNGLGVKKDAAKCDAILSESKYAWRNFYCGYLVPKNYDFAIYCLEKRKEFWAAETLARIYSGEYLPENADKAKAEYWRKITIDRRKEFFEEKAEYFKKQIEIWSAENYPAYVIELATFLGAQKFHLSDDWLYKNVEMKNPFYDLKAALALINDLDKRYANKPNEWEYLSRAYEGAAVSSGWKISTGESWTCSGPILEYFKKRAQKYDEATKQNKSAKQK